MTIDVATVATASGDPSIEGSVVVGVNKFGANHTINPNVNSTITPEALETNLTDRFDDIRYYSGDTDS